MQQEKHTYVWIGLIKEFFWQENSKSGHRDCPRCPFGFDSREIFFNDQNLTWGALAGEAKQKFYSRSHPHGIPSIYSNSGLHGLGLW